jgi:beta-N-acetylhexosaminidase
MSERSQKPANGSVDLRGKPFELSKIDVAWVEATLAKMSLEDKVGQLFCLMVKDETKAELRSVLADIKPGGFMFRSRPAIEVQRFHRHLQDNTAIPLLLAGNFERGGNGIATDGTEFASPLQVAATDDEEQAYRLGLVCGREGYAIGCNWAFGPVVDLDFNFRNPITNTRTFGSSPERVLRLALGFMRGLQECGLAASVKHWPGDGVDDRDQHLLPSVNTLSTKEWDKTFGYVFRGAIEAGTKAIMSAHIMLPAYSRKLASGIKDEDLLPASLAPELNIQLLRERLGFNGLIVTDATTMVGFTQLMPRRLAVPKTIAAGCDMFLFAVDLKEDVRFMVEGVRTGLLSLQRLDEAVLRILALKASLNLHRRQAEGKLVPPLGALAVLRSATHLRWAQECADKSVTLVKDTQHLLPLSPVRHRRILMHVLADKSGNLEGGEDKAHAFKVLLEQAGFEVSVFDHADPGSGKMKSASSYAGKFDVILYFICLRTVSFQSVMRINWQLPFAVDAPRYISEIPTLAVSIGNPYHLQDMPRMKTFINGYTGNKQVLSAMVEKILGRSAFSGTSPVDPFCGYWDARF